MGVNDGVKVVLLYCARKTTLENPTMPAFVVLVSPSDTSSSFVPLLMSPKTSKRVYIWEK